VSIRQIVGNDRYEQLRRALRTAFPDKDTVVTDGAVDVAFQVAKFEWHAPDLRDLPIPPAPAVVPPPSAASAGSRFQYYEGRATHTRVGAPGSVFTGHLPLVRFRLPDQGTTQTLPTIKSPAGDILPVDRLNPSVDVLWATYKGDPLLTFGRPARVDMITPPRLDGARFAAISLYLCYAGEADVSPSFYILEAGLATGQARMPFLGRTMESPILAQTQYKPTTFSQPFHIYSGKLTMRAEAPGEPQALSVRVHERKPPSDPYLVVTVDYQKRETPLLTNPFHLTIAAGARVQAIADALGIPSGLDEAFFLRLLAALDRNNLFSVPPH
jgi:hypothetical protein